jgi:hypothetical protein
MITIKRREGEAQSIESARWSTIVDGHLELSNCPENLGSRTTSSVQAVRLLPFEGTPLEKHNYVLTEIAHDFN